MPKTPRKAAADNRRASPEAVAKRRAARAFNEVLLGSGPREGDGRTERRRRRLLRELAKGVTASGQELKPIDVLLHVQALLELGETVESLRKARPAAEVVPVTDALVEGVRKLHAAYAFAPEVYRFVGIDDEALALAGVQRKKRGPVKARPRPSSGAARRGAA
ncbi:MAG: hypothetical protein R3B70_44990 [Polyangiaceae bacterium]